jgi:hypothetical protein
MLAAGAVLVAGLALAAIPHRPSTAQRAADLRGMVHDLTTDIESCAGGVSDSITALRAIQSGASNDVKTAVKIANTAAANCSPANSMPMEDWSSTRRPSRWHPSTSRTPSTTSLRGASRWRSGSRPTSPAWSRPRLRTRSRARPRSCARISSRSTRSAARIDQLINAASTSLSAHVAPPSLPS